MKNYKSFYLIFLLLISCNKLIDIGEPKNEITSVEAFTDEQSAIAVVSNIYSQFTSLIAGNHTSLISLYSDDLLTSSNAPVILEYFNSQVDVANSSNLAIWRSYYTVIYQCNSLLENIEFPSKVSLSLKRQLKSEILFLRSLSYFYLVNLYGDVPLVLTTDVKVTSSLSRVSISKVYEKIIEDLLEAKKMISDVYPSSGKVRANKMCVSALLSRIYLYRLEWENAEAESSLILESGIYGLTENTSKVFIKNSTETILEFWTKQGYTSLGPLFIPISSATPSYPISSKLFNSFEINDQRKTEWIHSVSNSSGTFYYPFKYKNRTTVSGSNEEYLSLFRLSEQYLIRAEARVNQDKIPEGLKDLNLVRVRAGLPELNLGGKNEMLDAIEQERKVELFCEWGHRFFDLKRYGHLDQLSAIKPNWKKTFEFLPIPQYEILNNPNLTQNPGY